MAIRKTAKKETKTPVNEATITMTVDITSVVKFPTNDPDKAAKAIENEKKRIARKLTAVDVDDIQTTKEKVFLNVSE